MAHLAASEDQQQVDQLVTEAEAATLLGLAPRTLQFWRSRGFGPRWLRLSPRSIRYRRSDLRTWLDQQTVGAVQ